MKSLSLEMMVTREVKLSILKRTSGMPWQTTHMVLESIIMVPLLWEMVSSYLVATPMLVSTTTFTSLTEPNGQSLVISNEVVTSKFFVEL